MPNNTTTDVNSSSIEPLRIGIKVKPPTLTLRYRVKKDGQDDCERLRLMPIRNLNKYGPVAISLAQLRLRHRNYLHKIPDVRLEKLLRLLQEVSCGRQLDDAVLALNEEYSVDPQQDLNKLSEAELDKKKRIMESSFTQNQIKPGDRGYEYDKRVEFSSDGIEPAGWDSEEENFWD